MDGSQEGRKIEGNTVAHLPIIIEKGESTRKVIWRKCDYSVLFR